MRKEKELYFEGYVLSKGIAIGTPYFLHLDSHQIPDQDLLSLRAVENEVVRYKKAIHQAHEHLAKLKNRAELEDSPEIVAVLESHLQIIADPLLNEEMEDEIRTLSKNAEFILQKAVERFEKKFHKMQDLFFQQRIDDVHDISQRILDSLQKKNKTHVSELPPDSVIFAKTINPSDAAEAKRKNVVAFVTEYGSTLSHTAIIAKARGIPYLSTTHFSKLTELDVETPVIVDGIEGKIIVHPTNKTIERYTKLQKKMQAHYNTLQQSSQLPSHTLEGELVSLYVSIDGSDEFVDLKGSGAHGVGLFRTEYLVLEQGGFPTEEEQFKIYKNLVLQMDGSPVVIRTFDLSLDKVLSHAAYSSIELGSKAIRFFLKEKTLLLTQLRAILRASVYGNVQLLFPMISSLQELKSAKILLRQAQEQIARKGVTISQSIPVGCMVEVPTAAMACDLLVRECDFLSIGTNDLMQYTLAIDRLNQSSHIVTASTHSGFLRLLQMIMEEGAQVGIPVYVCGEMAGDPKLTPLLVGLGAKGFSVPVRLLPIIKHIVRLTSKAKSVRLAQDLVERLELDQGEKILGTYYKKHFPSGVNENF